jgi:hypothetical protein
MMFGGASTEEATVGVSDADGGAPKPDRREDRRRWYCIFGSTIGVLGFAIAMTLLYEGARSVEAQGGFCASGGPYVIAHQCTSGETTKVLIGIVGILVFGAIFVGLTAFADGPVLVPSGLLWAALFGSLGVGFLDVPKSGGGPNWVVGIMFVIMGAAGIWPAISQGASWLKRGGEPDTSEPTGFANVPLVRASVAAPAPMQVIADSPAAPASGPVIPSRLVIPPKDQS